MNTSILDEITLLLRDLWEGYFQARISPEADTLTQTRQRILHYLLLSLSALSIFVFVPFTTDIVTRTQSWELFLTLLVVIIIIWVTMYNQQWPYYLRTAVLLSVFYGLAVHDLLTIGLVGANSTMLLFIPLLVFTLLNLQAGIFASIANIALFALMAWQHNAGNLPLEAESIALYATADGWFIIGGYLGILAVLSAILLGEMSSNVAYALQTEEMLDQQLESEQNLLQTRIINRTRGLQASTEVSRRISTILDSSELAETVVQQIQQVFGYYHVQLYEFTPDKQYLKLTAATGTAGQEMLAHNHRLATWRGLVGQAGGSAEPQLVTNVQESHEWLPNPLLPDTVAELAVPVQSGDDTLGVLDIQHHEPGLLDEDTVYVMQTIASQVAVAFQNATLYEQVEAQARREKLLEHISQQIRTAASTEEALRVATTELAQALNLKRTEIKLGL